MASRRKIFKPARPETEVHIAAAFIADVLSGAVKAEKLHLVRNGQAGLRFEYDDPDPDRPGAPQ